MIFANDSIFGIFTKSISQLMRRYKVKEVIKMLEREGWYIDRQRGTHRQFKHPTKNGTVTVNQRPNETLNQHVLNSIFKQAEWK